MNFSPKTITIYSVGLLGGSIGAGLKKSGYEGKIIGLSSQKGIQSAIKLGCIDEGYGYESLSKVIKETDLLILCSPILAIMETLSQLGQCDLPEGLVITDVGSTKSEIVKMAKTTLPDHVYFIGGHPMAGSEKSGPDASDPYLFQNAIYVFTPPSGQAGEKDSAIAEFFESNLGCRHVFLPPDTHDSIAAAVSHLPHLTASALVLSVNKHEESVHGTMDLAAGGFRDITRIASAPYSMWHDILVTNKKYIGSMLDSLIENLSNFKTGLENDSLQESFEKARQIREQIPFTNKGFIRKLSEILVMAEDRPGFISSLACILAQQDINIKDIEVLKVREGEGGTIRIAFETQEVANSAISVLTDNGFTVRERT
ncbi:Prephenate and/or arogenate dehydrogenase [Chitinispirillum alkaliphilum]|nr:Prephenate and/or arogenate dehydrogenase [Chitinispirillum alkaliphilum]